MVSANLFVVAVAALVQNAYATVSMTSPVASTTCTGGKPCTVAWQDDGKAPNLQQFGTANVGVFAGNVNQQTLLQSIQTNVNVATTAQIQFTVDPTIGPNSNEYFVRFASVTGTDSTTGFPLESFSAKFTLAGMSGTFNASVSAQIQGETSAPLPPPASATPTGSNSGSSPASSGGASSGASAKPTGSGSTTAAQAGASNSGAMSSYTIATTGLVGSVFTLFMTVML